MPPAANGIFPNSLAKLRGGLTPPYSLMLWCDSRLSLPDTSCMGFLFCDLIPCDCVLSLSPAPPISYGMAWQLSFHSLCLLLFTCEHQLHTLPQVMKVNYRVCKGGRLFTAEISYLYFKHHSKQKLVFWAFILSPITRSCSGQWEREEKVGGKWRGQEKERRVEGKRWGREKGKLRFTFLLPLLLISEPYRKAFQLLYLWFCSWEEAFISYRIEAITDCVCKMFRGKRELGRKTPREVSHHQSSKIRNVYAQRRLKGRMVCRKGSFPYLSMILTLSYGWK